MIPGFAAADTATMPEIGNPVPAIIHSRIAAYGPLFLTVPSTADVAWIL
jgi:hypothetical protein